MTGSLHQAIGHPDQLRALIANGASLDQPDDDGASPLLLAVMSHDIECVEILLVAGANPNALAEEPAATIYAPTPLSLAHQARFFMNDQRYAPIVELLTAHGAVDELWTRG